MKSTCVFQGLACQCAKKKTSSGDVMNYVTCNKEDETATV